MEQVTRQLDRLRRKGRWMLIVQRLCEAGAVLIALLLALGLIDFALRLPAGLRGAVTVTLAVGLVLWIGSRLWRAVRFQPSLSDLALRAERLFPHLAGELTSGVEFTLHADDYRQPQRTAEFASASVQRTQAKLQGVELHRLVDYTRTLRRAAGLLLAVIALGSVLAAAPAASHTAFARWVTPWRDVEWPKRTDIESLTADTVWPTDTPLRLRAAVYRGHRPDMRVWLHYRLIEKHADGRLVTGPWQPPLLMSQQTAANGPGAGDHPTFERLIDLPELTAAAGAMDAAPGGPGGDPGVRYRVAYYFEADDDQTAPAEIAMVPRPAVTAIRATLTPPTYAAGLVSEQTLALHEQSPGSAVAAATGLVGTQVTLDVQLNKPLPPAAMALAELAPGLPADARIHLHPGSAASAAVRQTETPTSAFTITFTLRDTVETPLRLTDAHGLSNLSERRYRLEAVEDQPPAASLIAPASDEAVLPTAVVTIEALAQDDVGVEEVQIEAEVPPAPAGSGSPETAAVVGLARQTGQAPSLTATHALDLGPLGVQPGQTVTLYAIARDVFELDGRRHDPVRSAPRRLRIIDEATLIGQIRNELAGVRQQALRLDEQQQQIAERPPAEAAPAQARLSRRLQTQAALVDRLEQRAQRNRLEEPALNELLTRSRQLIDAAEAASDTATERLDTAADPQTDPAAAEQAAAEAQQQQAQVQQQLSELVSLLDQGQDALTLQLQLRQLQTEQETLEADTRRLLPQTVGRELNQLPQELRDALRDLAERQAAAAEEAASLVRQMQSTAQALSRQADSDRARAAAEALAEAAAIAERQGLSQTMEEAAESVEQNQLSQAGGEQAQGLETMQQMLAEMGRQQERMQAMLRRRLQELAEALERLIDRQRTQIPLLEQEQDLRTLAPAQSALRRTTMAVEQQARESPETEPVAELIAHAVDAQARAVTALQRVQQQPARMAEQEAVDHLTAALEEVRKQRQQAQQEQVAQERRELKEAYEKLAEQQDALREQVAELTGEGPLDRRQRAALVGLGHEQADLKIAAAELAQQVGEVMLFQHLHRQIDRSAERAAEALRRAAAGEPVLRDQQAVARYLRTMAEALDEDAQPAEFAGQQGGGGAGGGGGQPPPLVPPVAELKALRGLQETVYQRTRALAESAGPDGGASMRRALLDLSAEQRELAALGERLIQHLQAGQQPPTDGRSP